MAGINRRFFNTGLQNIYNIQGGGIPFKSIQTASLSMADTVASDTQSITEVDTSSTILLASENHNGNTTTWDSAFSRWDLQDSTTVRAQRLSTDDPLNLEVTILEFKPELVKSLQTGTTTITGSATATQSITGVDLSKSFVLSYGQTASTTSDDTREIKATVKFNSFDELIFTKFNPTVSLVCGWAVIEFY